MRQELFSLNFASHGLFTPPLILLGLRVELRHRERKKKWNYINFHLGCPLFIHLTLKGLCSTIIHQIKKIHNFKCFPPFSFSQFSVIPFEKSTETHSGIEKLLCYSCLQTKYRKSNTDKKLDIKKWKLRIAFLF